VQLDAEIQKVEKDAALAKPQQARLNELRGRRHALMRSNLPADLPGAYAVQEGKPVNVNLHVRGEVNQPGPVVQRDAPRFLIGGQRLQISKDSSGRLQFAQWLTHRNNPLTARVMVNRIWQHHFGKGIVATPSNFGARGEAPSHPELLDLLAARFVTDSWS